MWQEGKCFLSYITPVTPLIFRKNLFSGEEFEEVSTKDT